MKDRFDQLRDVLNPAQSAEYLSTLGYSSEEIYDLHGSGLCAVQLQSLAPEVAIGIIGSDPANLFSPHANWNEYRRLSYGSRRTYLFDFYTGALFEPMQLRPVGLFGHQGHTHPFAHSAVELPILLRSRFQRIPMFLINSERELRDVAAAIAQTISEPFKLLFRGQTDPFFVQRRPRVAALLYGEESAREPSLPSAAFRKRFSYVSAERYWKAIIADIDYRLTGYSDKRWWVEDKLEEVYVSTGGQIALWHRLSTMAIAQHYGLPTFGLDVTASVDAAWWFATHKFIFEGADSRYESYCCTDMNPMKWPVIYAIRSEDWRPLTSLQLPAERPRSQDGYFIHGSWGPHGNICADDVAAVLVLGSELGMAPASVEELFPGPATDPFYHRVTAVEIILRAGSSHL